MKRTAVILILVLAFCGLADSAYVAQHQATGTPLICNIQNLSGCNVVAQSPYSKFMGVPIAEYGMFFYGIVFVLAALELVVFDRLLRRALQAMSIIGIVASLYFMSLQVFVINALCAYCLGSALITVFIFVLATKIEPMKKNVLERVIIPPPPAPPPYLSMPPSA